MRFSARRRSGVAIRRSALVLGLVMAAAGSAEEVEVLRGPDGWRLGDPEALADVVVLRGARLGGPIPEPDPTPRPPPEVIRAPELAVRVVNVLIVPIISVTTSVSVLPSHFVRKPHRSRPSVWRLPSRASR